MHWSGFAVFAWIASFLLNLLLAFVLFYRGRAPSFPFFTVYVVEQIVDLIALYVVTRHASLTVYRYFYWSTNWLEQILQVCVFYEIAVHVFCPVGVWARDVRRTFVGLIVLSLVVASLLSWLAHPTAPYLFVTFYLRTSFFSAALLSELFVGMAMLSATAGLLWKTHVARIAQGLGIYSIVRLAAGIIQNAAGIHPGWHVYTISSHTSDMTYIICAFYWVVTLYAEAPAPRELPEEMRMQIYTLQRQVENDLTRIRAWRKR